MKKAEHGHTVTVHYTGTLQDGSEFDSSRDRDPFTFTIGAGQVIRGFEQCVLGMCEGEAHTVTIPPADAYGERVAELVMEVDRQQVPSDLVLELGQMLEVGQPDGQPVQVTVVALSDETVTLDANPPLAGEELVFAIECVSILD